MLFVVDTMYKHSRWLDLELKMEYHIMLRRIPGERHGEKTDTSGSKGASIFVAGVT